MPAALAAAGLADNLAHGLRRARRNGLRPDKRSWLRARAGSRGSAAAESRTELREHGRSDGRAGGLDDVALGRTLLLARPFAFPLLDNSAPALASAASLASLASLAPLAAADLSLNNRTGPRTHWGAHVLALFEAAVFRARGLFHGRAALGKPEAAFGALREAALSRRTGAGQGEQGQGCDEEELHGC